MSFGTIALLLIIVAVPGTGMLLACYRPGAVGPATGLALIPVLGYATVGGTAFVLTLLHALYPLPLYVVLATVTVSLWTVGLRRGSLPARARTIREGIRSDQWPFLVGLIVMVAIAVVALSFSPALNFGSSSSWRYWADAKEIADAGRVPSHSLQYGVLLQPTVSKTFLNSFNAALSFDLGRSPLAILGALVWLGAVSFALGLWALGRELGLRLTAPLLPLLIMMNRSFLYKEISSDLHVYKAETFGRAAAVAAVILAIRALRDRRSWLEAVLAGAVFGVAAGTHLVPTLVAVLVVAWYAIARLLRETDRAALAARTAAVGAISALMAGGLLFLPKGDIGFQGSAGNQAYRKFSSNFDPTKYVAGGRSTPGAAIGRSHFYIPPGQVYEGFVVRATRVSPTSRIGRHGLHPLELLLAVGGLIVAILVLVWFPKEFRGNALLAWGLGASLVGGALYFSYRYHLFVLAWFGVRRLFDYSAIPLILFGVTLLEGGLFLVGRSRPLVPAVAGTAVVVVAAALLLPHARLTGVADTATRAAPVDWIRENIPCGSRLLLDERTAGVLQATTGRVGILEGMAPHLRPQVLSRVVNLLERTRAFFADPVRRQGFLLGEAVDYVIVHTSIAGYRGPLGHPDLAALDRVPSLRLFHSGQGLMVYQVFPPPTHSRYPSPAGFPGYECVRGPIA